MIVEHPFVQNMHNHFQLVRSCLKINFIASEIYSISIICVKGNLVSILFFENSLNLFLDTCYNLLHKKSIYF